MSADMAHQPVQEPRWRWWLGAAAECAVLLGFVALVLLVAGIQS